MTTNNHTQATVSFTKAASRLFLSISISKQLYTAPSQPYTELVSSRLVSVPDQRPWFLVWEQDYVCACIQKRRPSQWVASRLCCEQLLKLELELRRS